MSSRPAPLQFHKMHGAGNDFVLIDARSAAQVFDPRRASRIADRHLGIGCDQILVLRRRPARAAGCATRSGTPTAAPPVSAATARAASGSTSS